MHIKKTRKVRGSKARTYLSLAHNVRKTLDLPDGRKKHQSQPVIFANLGAEEDLDRTFVEGAVAALQRYLKKRWGTGAKGDSRSTAVQEAAAEIKQHSSVLRLICHREFGLRLLLTRVWEDLVLRAT